MSERADWVDLVWAGLDAPRMEFAHVLVTSDLQRVAFGHQIGAEPVPYHLYYSLTLSPDGVARRFDASVTSARWSRVVFVERGEDGAWSVRGPSHEDDEAPGTEEAALAGALDVDLGFSPLFNSTPVLRDGLHLDGAEPHDYLMAWVSVPDLTVTASRQRYEPLGREGDLAIVRYTSLDSGFTAKIAFDGDGFVVDYEGFLQRIAVERSPATQEAT